MKGSEDMDKAHRQDTNAQRLFDDVVRSVDALLADETACRKLGPGLHAHVLRAKDICEGRSQHITATWN